MRKRLTETRMVMPLILSAFLFLSACSSIGGDRLDETKAAWSVAQSGEVGSVIAKQKLVNGQISVICAPQGCQAIIEAGDDCKIGAVLPVLMNTAIEVGVTEGECLSSDYDAANKRHSSLILLVELNLLVPNIVLSDDATFAVPMASGRVQVYLVRMAGLRQRLAEHVPSLFKAPTWPDDGGLEPLPVPDDMDEQETLRWQRGLLAI